MNDIEKILYRQQCLEYTKNLNNADLKKFTEQEEFPDVIIPELSPYAEKLREECRKLLRNRSVRGMHLFRRILIFLYILLALCMISCLYINVNMRDEAADAWRTPWESGNFEETEYFLPEAPQSHAMAELDKGYQSAKKVYLEAIREHPYAFANYVGYSKVCVQEGNYDEAASVLVYYINEQYGVENIEKNNLIYEDLRQLNGPFSTRIQEKYDSCIKTCQKWISRFQELDQLLEDKNYEEVLTKADWMRKEGSTDSSLFPYIANAYLGLENYEACAVYLLDTAHILQEDFDPDVYQTCYTELFALLKKTKPHVSETLRRQIERLQE